MKKHFAVTGTEGQLSEESIEEFLIYAIKNKIYDIPDDLLKNNL